MRLSIFARGFELTEALHDHVSRRAGFALSRYKQVVKQVQIRLSDINGPRGGDDKQCVFLVDLVGSAPVVIRERDADAYAAIDRAADRVDRAVARLIERRRPAFGRSLPHLAG
jgi:putative sigma-54 modulation protein